MHLSKAFILVVAIINLQLLSSSHLSRKDLTCSFVLCIFLPLVLLAVRFVRSFFYYSTHNFKNALFLTKYLDFIEIIMYNE